METVSGVLCIKAQHIWSWIVQRIPDARLTLLLLRPTLNTAADSTQRNPGGLPTRAAATPYTGRTCGKEEATPVSRTEGKVVKYLLETGRVKLPWIRPETGRVAKNNFFLFCFLLLLLLFY